MIGTLIGAGCFFFCKDTNFLANVLTKKNNQKYT